MRTISSDGAAPRWIVRLALVAGLLALLISLTPALHAQGQPPGPQFFFGKDASAYAGSEIKVFNENGVEISSGGEGTGIIGSDGTWSVQIIVDDVTRAKLRIVSASGDRETELLDLIEFDIKEISIRDFSPVSGTLEDPGDTLAVRLIARLHPTRPLRTLEFNMRVNGIDVDPPPAKRFLTPRLLTDRWYASTEIDVGGGYSVRIIACKQSDDDVIFGLRVDGYDDIIPKGRRLGSAITHNRWLHSTEIQIPLPRDNDDVVRLGRGDIDCTAHPLAP